MKRTWQVQGTVVYLLQCPAAPGQNCVPKECPHHPYRQPLTLYVAAPTQETAVQQAINKAGGTYPYATWESEPTVEPVETASGDNSAEWAMRRAVQRHEAAPLPGTETVLGLMPAMRHLAAQVNGETGEIIEITQEP